MHLKRYDTGWVQHEMLKTMSEERAKGLLEEMLEKDRAALAEAQELLAASQEYGMLIVLQGMDTAGKDGTIRHVMSGVNPQGCSVHSFKVPSPEDHAHDFLWRYSRVLPERGMIGIFNRSYYEDVLVVRVHPERVETLPGKLVRAAMVSGPPGSRISMHLKSTLSGTGRSSSSFSSIFQKTNRNGAFSTG